MTRPGVLHWTPRPHYRSGLFLNGYRFVDAAGDGQTKPFSYRRGEGFATATSQAGTTCSQSRGLLGDQPVDLTPAEGSIDMLLKWEEEHRAIREALAVARPARLYFGEWHVDRWWLFGAGAARTEFRTSRPMPYDLPAPVGAADWSAYTPQAKLVDSAGTETAQTVITSGTPSAGEVLVPDTGGGLYETIETPAVSTLGGAEWLALYYPAVFIVVASADYDYPVPNGFKVVVEFREILSGTYEGAAA